MRYAYSLAKPVKQYVEWELQHYHQRIVFLADMKEALMPRIASVLDSTGGGGGGLSDTTADAAVRIATDEHISRLETKISAVRRVVEAADDIDRTLISLRYWRQTHTVDGAARAANISTSAAYYRINKILCSIAKELGEI